MRRRSPRPRRCARRCRCGCGYAPRHRSAGARSDRRASVSARLPCRSSGRVSRRPVRSASTSIGASSQTVIARSLSSCAGARVDESAAAGRNHPDGPVDQPGDQPPLAVAKIMLAKAFEQVRRSTIPAASSISDIAVDERQAEPPGQPAADGRLARAHQPDQHDRAIENVGQLLHFVAASIWAGLYREAQGRAKAFRHTHSPSGVTMPRGLIFLILVILLLVGGLFFLSQQRRRSPGADHRGRRHRQCCRELNQS